jgi:predicted double-glycine peptidase
MAGIFRSFAALAAACIASGWHAGAAAQSLESRITSLQARRDAGVVKQRYDFSCGSASLATLLTYGLNDRVDEDVLLRTLLGSMSPEDVEVLSRKGLSLHDLQRLAELRGHKAQGFRLHQAQLARVTRPVIVFIKPDGYEHFAVLKGLRGDRVYLADPSLGNVRMPLYRFLDMWADESGRGIVFAVDRADGIWPEHYPLELADAPEQRLEAVSARRLIEAGKPFPSMAPDR